MYCAVTEPTWVKTKNTVQNQPIFTLNLSSFLTAFLPRIKTLLYIEQNCTIFSKLFWDKKGWRLRLKVRLVKVSWSLTIVYEWSDTRKTRKRARLSDHMDYLCELK